MTKITLEDVKNNPTIAAMVEQANANLEAIGYTDHGPRHVGYVSKKTAETLEDLNYPERTVELGAITGWIHDVGNLINRYNHGPSGALLLFPILREMGMQDEEALTICGAIGNHEEQTGQSVSAVSAALIIADKSDAHRARVRRNQYNFDEIHDRVNFSISKTDLSVDKENRIIRYAMIMGNSSSISEFLQIYMSRMLMASEAARFLDCSYELVINGMLINNEPVSPNGEPEHYKEVNAIEGKI